jgi:hypothetical protein
MVSGLRVNTAHAGDPGGRIKTPRSIDPARRARNMKTNRFDLAGLADSGYHIGDDGVALLNERIISNCGYQSYHVDHLEDVLLCFQEIVNLHRLVVQTWTNTRLQCVATQEKSDSEVNVDSKELKQKLTSIENYERLG